MVSADTMRLGEVNMIPRGPKHRSVRRHIVRIVIIGSFLASMAFSTFAQQHSAPHYGVAPNEVYLGLSAVSAGTDPARRLGISQLQGAVVQVLTPGSPAAKAGLQIGDLLLQFGDREINLIEDLVAVARDQSNWKQPSSSLRPWTIAISDYGNSRISTTEYAAERLHARRGRLSASSAQIMGNSAPASAKCCA